MSNGAVRSFQECLRVLRKSDRKKYIGVLLLQAMLGLFDLAGVALAGIIGSLSIRGVQSQAPGTRVQTVLSLFRLEGLNFQKQIALLGGIAVILLITKTILTVIITRRILGFLANRSFEIAGDLISRTLNQPMNTLQAQNTSEFQFAMSGGISSITMGILGVASTAVADLFLVGILVAGICYLDFFMAVIIGTLFGGTALILNKILKSRATYIGETIVKSEIEANKKIAEVRTAYREILVRNRRSYYSDEISSLKKRAMNGIAEQTFLPNVSKYVFEVAILLGAVFTAGFQIWTKDVSHAAASLTLFLVAGSRLAPAILRIQQNSVLIQMNFASASETLSSLQLIRNIPRVEPSESILDFVHSTFVPSVTLEKVNFKYKGSAENTISNLSLEISPGDFVAIVGSSGAGKSTLADLILGINNPDSGFVEISGVSPLQAIDRWPGAIAYVPQNVGLFEGSIFDNLRIGYQDSEAFIPHVNRALEQSHLGDFLSMNQIGADLEIGEGGSKLSGGQRQRLGIARALFTNPKLIVMDEATSALDGITENAITESIQSLRGNVTLIVIAHRLSTVRNADLVVYMEEGKLTSVGSFDEVRRQIADFDAQATAMGL